MIDKVVPTDGLFQSPGVKPLQTGNRTDMGQQFDELLDKAIDRLAANEQQVHQFNQAFAAGQMQGVEQLLITAEKASLQLELTVQIRNKVIEAYQEIMRTQI